MKVWEYEGMEWRYGSMREWKYEVMEWNEGMGV